MFLFLCDSTLTRIGFLFCLKTIINVYVNKQETLGMKLCVKKRLVHQPHQMVLEKKVQIPQSWACELKCNFTAFFPQPSAMYNYLLHSRAGSAFYISCFGEEEQMIKEE